jgi:predicted DNA repair protein MutK
VTPRYVTGFTPDRELPIIWRIARGSLKNKLLFILPVALALSAFLPWAITPILMIGGAYLCFEGAEKVIEKLRDIARTREEELAEEVATLNAADHEETMVAGAIRTDFILSAEIMAIALNDLASGGTLSDVGEGLPPVVAQALALGIVAIAITIGVYGLVGLIVKMDDIGLHMAKAGSAARQAIGRALVRAMPKLLAALAFIGTAAMLWVGGQIIVHGMGLHPAEWVGTHGGLAGWIADAGISGLIGFAIGAVIVGIHHAVVHFRGGAAAH